MVRDEVHAVDVYHNPLAYARRAASDDEIWEGTGVNQPGFLLFPNFDLAIDWIITNYPGLNAMKIVINDRFTYVDMGEMARAHLVGAVKEKLTPPESTIIDKGEL